MCESRGFNNTLNPAGILNIPNGSKLFGVKRRKMRCQGVNILAETQARQLHAV